MILRRTCHSPAGNKHCKKDEDAIVGEISGSDIETVDGRGKEIIEYLA
jgi:hypothetical protein